uniref:Actin binding LIM protein family, member 2 n=1 Tax=Poecilia formosa TaxID=48698 RepID=A0A096MHB9_POEFO
MYSHLSFGLILNCPSNMNSSYGLLYLLRIFKCQTCLQALNTTESMTKENVVYHHYFNQRKFLHSCFCYYTENKSAVQAGEKHYHPTCARCARCEQMFGEGEEMYLQGSSIWHPPCRQAAKQEEKSKVTRTSSESITSVPASSASGSPSRVIYAKLGEEMLDYKDLAALPKTKAIYNIDRPDMLSYSPYISYPSEERHYGEGDGEKSPRQRRPSSPSSNSSLGGYGRYTPSRSPQNYSRPGIDKYSPTPLSGSASLSLHLNPTTLAMLQQHNYIPYFRGSESGRSTPSLSTYSDGKSPSSTSTYVAAPRHFHIPEATVKDNIYRKPPIYKQHDCTCSKAKSAAVDVMLQRTSWIILKSETDGEIAPENLNPCKSTCSLPMDTSQPKLQLDAESFKNFPYNKSASLPGYGRNGIYKAADMVEDDVDPDSHSWGGMRGETKYQLENISFSSSYGA